MLSTSSLDDAVFFSIAQHRRNNPSSGPEAERRTHQEQPCVGYMSPNRAHTPAPVGARSRETAEEDGSSRRRPTRRRRMEAQSPRHGLLMKRRRKLPSTSQRLTVKRRERGEGLQVIRQSNSMSLLSLSFGVVSKTGIVFSESVIRSHHSMFSNFLTQRAVVFSRSRTLVRGKSAYFSSSEIGRTLANQYGNRAGSDGGSP